MNVRGIDPYEWFAENTKLVHKVCWKAKSRSDCPKRLSVDDFYTACLDSIERVFRKDDGRNKLSSFVMQSLYFECRHLINKRVHYHQVEDEEYGDVRIVANVQCGIESITRVDEADYYVSILREVLTDYEYQLLIEHIVNQKGYREIGRDLQVAKSKIERDFWKAFYKSRKLLQKLV